MGAMREEEYFEINRDWWNQRTEAHLNSEFYKMSDFMKGGSSLNEIERTLLDGLVGRSVLHLQCHFGQDTLSINRLGAEATGVDFSDLSIRHARRLAGELNAGVEFICCNLYDLPQHLDRQFDIVFASYGTIGWLPDLDRWAAVISHHLKQGGRFILVEFHPFLWIFDSRFEKIKYRYFNSDPIVESEKGSYADKDSETESETVTWNHSLSEVGNALIGSGLTIEELKEYDYSPYEIFPGMEQVGEKKYRIARLGDKIPMTYSIVATKPGLSNGELKYEKPAA